MEISLQAILIKYVGGGCLCSGSEPHFERLEIVPQARLGQEEGTGHHSQWAKVPCLLLRYRGVRTCVCVCVCWHVLLNRQC